LISAGREPASIKVVMKQQAERAATAPAEDPSGVATLRAMPLYGAGGWREQNQHLFSSDASLRWLVAQHRLELERSGALAIFAGRVCGVMPVFNAIMLRIAQEAAGYQTDARRRALAAAVAGVDWATCPQGSASPQPGA
jgi:hypothetical protein